MQTDINLYFENEETGEDEKHEYVITFSTCRDHFNQLEINVEEVFCVDYDEDLRSKGNMLLKKEFPLFQDLFYEACEEAYYNV